MGLAEQLKCVLKLCNSSQDLLNLLHPPKKCAKVRSMEFITDDNAYYLCDIYKHIQVYILWTKNFCDQ